jgi:outer membrane protein TolC
MSTRSRGASRPRPQLAVPLPILLVGLGACSAPAPAPLAPGDLARSVHERDALPQATPEEVAAALELSGLDPLGAAAAPAEVALEVDPGTWWHARAETWSPAVRAARRRLEQALAEARSAGAPGPLMLEGEVREVDDLDAHTRVGLTVDVIGLLRLEPSRAARALADAQARTALGELDAARWEARFEVDGARARLAAARAALADLERLGAEVEQDLRRIEVLERHGRLAAAQLADARMARAELHRVHSAQVELQSRSREDLAVAAGLPSESTALAGAGGATLDGPEPPRDAPDAEALCERLPELRLALFEYALAEARLRAAAAERWPSLDLGPQLTWAHPDLLLGALAAAGLPWPGSLSGSIEAAHVGREAARERAEDALLAALARRAGALERLDNARAHVELGARPAQDASARRWTAARAALAVDAAALADWSQALSQRAEALAGLAEARGMHALARLELERAQGRAQPPVVLADAREVRP